MNVDALQVIDPGLLYQVGLKGNPGLGKVGWGRVVNGVW